MGTNPSWYFSRMQIEDLQTGDKYFFICENWLSLDDDDGLVSNYGIARNWFFFKQFLFL